MACAVLRARSLRLTEWNDVVAAHGRDRTLCLNGFHRYAARLCVGFGIARHRRDLCCCGGPVKRPCRIGSSRKMSMEKG